MKRYRIIAGVTVGAVVLLIVVGAIVRMTGSGMGCPDWPKCFGQYIPPTDISQLPADYKEVFKVAGKEIADFDAFKTWVEYLNRLLGALIGLFALGTAGAAAYWYYREERIPFVKRVMQLSIAGLLLVIIEGGIGAYVVRTNLHTGMITLHMVIALLVLTVFILALLMSYRPVLSKLGESIGSLPKWAGVLGAVVLVFTFAQIIMGAQVREQVDEIAKAMGEGTRGDWIAGLTGVYHVHKLFYYVLATAIIGWVAQLRPVLPSSKAVRILSMAIIVFLMVEIALGLSMHHFDIPAGLQPLHLLFATLLFAAEVGLAGVLYFLSNKKGIR